MHLAGPIEGSGTMRLVLTFAVSRARTIASAILAEDMSSSETMPAESPTQMAPSRAWGAVPTRTWMVMMMTHCSTTWITKGVYVPNRVPFQKAARARIGGQEKRHCMQGIQHQHCTSAQGMGCNWHAVHSVDPASIQ